MKYKINKTIMEVPQEVSAWYLAMANRQAVKAMLSVFLAGDICLTQEGYDKLDNHLKALFIGEKDSIGVADVKKISESQ